MPAKALLTSKDTGEVFEFDYQSTNRNSNRKFVKLYYAFAADLPLLNKSGATLLAYLMTHMTPSNHIVKCDYESVYNWCQKRKYPISRSTFYRACRELESLGWAKFKEGNALLDGRSFWVGK